MRFALVNGDKLEAQPKLKGICPNCSGEVIAKCGRVKVWHWAHKGVPPCDPWWESETEWHRQWKNHFPVEWQEVSHIDPLTQEKHIADVKTPHGLVIEFQHSVISPQELHSREQFYKEMIWIVDGNRNSIDRGNFNVGFDKQPIQNNPLIYAVVWWSRSRLWHNWAIANAKVFIDFGDDYVWRLVNFNAAKQIAFVSPIQKDDLIKDCYNGLDISITFKPDESV